MLKPSRLLLMHRKAHQRPSASAAAAAAAAHISTAAGAVTGLLTQPLHQPRYLPVLQHPHHEQQQQQQRESPAADTAAEDAGDYDDDDDDDGTSWSDEEFALAAARMYAPHKGASTPPPPPPPAVPKAVLEADAAVALVTRVWLERQVQLAGFQSIAAGSQLPPRPDVAYIHQQDQHGAFLVRVLLPPGLNESRSNAQHEVWHAFPRHGFAFTAADMTRLEKLTALDAQLVQTADLLLDLDTVWLQSLLHSHHYRKRMKSVATTYTACGFSGMMPLTDTVQDHVFQAEGLLQKSSSSWIS
jgi:hypothetical protein